MDIHLLYPVLPPVVDGIGDYTRCLAMALADQGPVTIWSNQHVYAPIERVTVRSACEIDRPRRMGPLAEAIVGQAPDWLVVQYNPFSYGKWGFNPALPAAIRSIRRAGVRMALMVHEPYVPFTDWRSVVMGSWHRWQLRALIASSDVVFFSIAPWADAFRRKLPRKRVEHLPVGSNIPNIHAPRDLARQALGIEDDVLVAGVFGSAHPSRRIGYVRQAIDAIRHRHPKIRVLSIGTAGQVLRQQLDPSIALTDTGILPAAAVSAHFSAMDLYFTPFRRGVSTRRGSFMVGLQHGIATLSTSGEHTDTLLSDLAGTAFMLSADGNVDAFARQAVALVDDPGFRNRVALEGQAFFERSLSWPRIAAQLVEVLRDMPDRSQSPRILTESAQ